MLKGICSCWLIWAGLLVSPQAAAQAGAKPAAADDAPAISGEAAATQRARRHFRTGIKLYRDANYKGALAEFEAAYREKPNAGSLQNVALCSKALFRYSEAAQTLQLLLARHSGELSDSEQAAVRQALTELEALVGSLSVTLWPEDAELSLDGRVIPREELARGIAINVGEHTILAEAKGYARHSEVVRVASQQRLALNLRLKPTAGFLEVTSSDPKAAIAIDDEPLAFAHWRGPVSPDVEHVVQIYREGFEPFERSVRVGLGQTMKVSGTLGPSTGDRVDEQAPLPAKPAAPPRSRGAVGAYALAALGVTGLNDAPLGLQIQSANADLSLPSFGLRGGYRLAPFVAVEGAFDFARADVKHACQSPDTNGVCAAERSFSLRSLRFGPNLKLMTAGEVLRFVSGVGAGVVHHRLELRPTQAGTMTLQGGTASGIDPYFSLELGIGFNFRHLLAELHVLALIEGASSLRGRFDEAEGRAVFANGALPMLGISLKVGYSAWAPRR